MSYAARAQVIERLYNRLLNARDSETEWRDWHARTAADVARIRKTHEQPLEVVDPTNIKFYNWTSRPVMSLGFLNKKSMILELGCGSGALSRSFTKQTGAHATLLDNETVALDYTKQVCADIADLATFVIGDAFNLSYNDNAFDLVHSTGLIEHFDESQINQLVAEHIRATKPGGYCYILVPNFFGPYIINLWRKYRKNTERYLTPRRLWQYCEPYNVELITKGSTDFTFHNRNLLTKIPGFEKLCGRLGFGFLNYVLVRKKSK